MYNTERLVLRPFRDSDVQDITAMWNDPTVQRGLAADHVHPRPPKFADEVRSLPLRSGATMPTSTG